MNRCRPNPPLGADWLTPRVAARLRDIEARLIRRRSSLYGPGEGLLVCQDAFAQAQPIVELESGQDSHEEHGIVFYPGLGAEAPTTTHGDPKEGSYWHWWIRLEDGSIVDVASSQFGERSPLVIPPGHPRQRWYLPEDPAGHDWEETSYGIYPWSFEHWPRRVSNPRSSDYWTWVPDPDWPVWKAALKTAGKVQRGEYSPEAAEGELLFFGSFAETDKDHRMVELLEKTIKHHSGREKLVDQLRELGATMAHLRARGPEGEHRDWWVTIVPKAPGDDRGPPGSWQVTRYGEVQNRETREWEIAAFGHHYDTDFETAVREAWSEYGRGGSVELLEHKNPPRRYQNPDPELRQLERRAAAGGTEDKLAYARARRRAGQPVQPWELEPLSYLFLDAARRLHSDPPGRVEGRRKVLFNANDVPFLAIGFYLRPSRPEPEPPDVISMAWPGEAAGQWNWRLGETSPGGVPAPQVKSNFKLGSSPETPLERFYVCPSSYPMYRNFEDWAEYSDLVQEEYETGAGTEASRRLEREMHLRAVDYFVSRGAIPWEVPHPPKSGNEEWKRWFEVYRHRVLVAYENLRGAREHAGWWGAGSPNTHNPRILFPRFWDSARLMTTKGKGKRRRWKNPLAGWDEEL